MNRRTNKALDLYLATSSLSWRDDKIFLFYSSWHIMLSSSFYMQSFRYSTHSVCDRLRLPPGWSKSSLCSQVISLVLSWGGSFIEDFNECYMKFISMKQAFIYLFISLPRLTSRRHGRWEGWRQKTAPTSVTHFRPVNCCRMEHNFFTIVYIGEVC